MAARRATTGSLAKTSAPRGVRVYLRKRLFKRLDVASKQPVVWIVGPAGAGKTTLVSSYVEDRKRPCVWYQLDPSDRDGAQLFEYLPRALAAAFPRRKAPRLPRFGPESLGGLPAFTRRYFEAVCEKLPDRTLLVFDNYQDVAADAAWHEVFREALAAVPAGVTAVVISRADPPPALARMIANGTLQRIEWSDLRLTEDETRGIARVHDHKLRTAASEQVHALADGWITGVILLLGQPSLPDATRRDPASQALFDYFAAEILDRLDPETRELLLRTSIVSSVDGELAQRLCPSLDAPRILARLRRDGLFTEYRGDGTYQYHPLFRTFLAAERDHALAAEPIAELRALAANHLADRDRVQEAIELLADPTARADLVEREAPRLMMRGRGVTVAGWLETLPDAVIDARGWLLCWKGICALGFAPDQSIALLTRAFERFRDPLDVPGLHLAFASAVQAIIHVGRDFRSLRTWIERYRTLPACPVAAIEARAATGMLMALTFIDPGCAEARSWAERASTLAASADTAQRLLTGGILVVYHSFFGEHARAASVVDLLRDLATDDADGLALVTLRQAEALHAWIGGDNEACLSATERGLDTASRHGIHVWNDQLCSFGVSAAFSSEQYPRVRRYIEIMAANVKDAESFTAGNYHYQVGMDAFIRGDLARAESDLDVSLRVADTMGYPFARAVSRIGLAQVVGRRMRPDEARLHLEQGRRIAAEAGADLCLYGAALVTADLALERGDMDLAHEQLREGLRCARERGYFNYWVTRPAMARLATFALERGIEVEYVQELVRRRQLVPSELSLHVDAWPWRLRVRMLGGLEVEGVPNIKGAPRRLLQAIVALARRSVSHEHIAGKLWPDAEGDATRGVFDTTLYRLRKLLPENVLELDGGRIALNRFAVWVDAHAFEHATDAILRRIGADDETSERAGARMFELYRGPLFGEDDEPWMTGPRERLHERFLQCADGLAARAAGRGSLDGARATYLRALDVDPTSERMHRGLIAVLLRMGLRADARIAFERCRRELERLGVKPSPETQSLVA